MLLTTRKTMRKRVLKTEKRFDQNCNESDKDLVNILIVLQQRKLSLWQGETK